MAEPPDSVNATAVAGRVSLVRAGDRRAMAALMRDLDDERPLALRVLQALRGDGLAAAGAAAAAAAGAPAVGGASASHTVPVPLPDDPHSTSGPHGSVARGGVVGVTGGAGAGKSTLVDALIAHWRAAGERVGVVAVDPTSPVGGGAVLGDRIRMQRHALDDAVFIRSVASRGALGGLSRSAVNVVTVLVAGGFSRVLVETVGAGQAEVDIAAATDVTVVVMTPGLGDDIQMLKAGILEIADVLVLNKADRPGSDATMRDLQAMLSLRRTTGGPGEDVPIVKTVANTGAGITQLAAEIDRARTRGGDLPGGERRRRRAEARIRAIVTARIDANVRRALAPGGTAAGLADDVAALRLDAEAAADGLMAHLREGYY